MQHCVTIGWVVLTQRQRVTDRPTDRRTDARKCYFSITLNTAGCRVDRKTPQHSHPPPCLTARSQLQQTGKSHPTRWQTARETGLHRSSAVRITNDVNLARIMGTDGRIQKAWWGRRGSRCRVWGGIPFPTGEEVWEGVKSPSQKKRIFTWNGVLWCILSGIFCPCPRQKHVKFPAWSGDLVDAEDVLLGRSEFSVKVMRLVSFLLHCNASNLVREILKHDIIWGTICISGLSLQIPGSTAVERSYL